MGGINVALPTGHSFSPRRRKMGLNGQSIPTMINLFLNLNIFLSNLNIIFIYN